MSTPRHELENPYGERLAVAASAVRQAARAAFGVHEELGESGLEEVQTNQFGDTALRGDVEAEAAVIDKLESTGKPIRVFSEEHGVVELHPDLGDPEMLAIVDGLDGSDEYKEKRGIGRYGTLIAIFDGADPTYGDYLAVSYMEHPTGRFILAAKGKGVSVNNFRTAEVTFPVPANATKLQPDSVIYVDSKTVRPNNPLYEYFLTNREAFARPLAKAGYQTRRLGSSGAHFATIVLGESVAVGEATRKGNLEFATAYALMRESGGVMTTLDGEDIGGRRFLEFGQSEHIPVLLAANPELGRYILDLLNRNRVDPAW